MNIDLNAIYGFWNCEPIEDHPTVPTKIKYRKIGGLKYQFRVLDYRTRTKLGYAIAGLVKDFMPVIKEGMNLIDTSGINDAAEMAKAEQANADKMLDVVPTLISKLAVPEFQELVDKLVVGAEVSLDGSKFDSLSNDAIAEQIFSDDITLQLPIALTVAEVNLDGFFQRIKGAFL